MVSQSRSTRTSPSTTTSAKPNLGTIRRARNSGWPESGALLHHQLVHDLATAGVGLRDAQSGVVLILVIHIAAQSDGVVIGDDGQLQTFKDGLGIELRLDLLLHLLGRESLLRGSLRIRR